ARFDQRNPGNPEALQHFRFRIAQRAMKQCVRAAIEIFEIPGKENDAKGVAISPFNLDFASVGQHMEVLFGPSARLRESLPQVASLAHTVCASTMHLR